MEHQAIIKILQELDAGRNLTLLYASTGKRIMLSRLSHVFVISRLTRLSQVECAQPIPEWGDTFPARHYPLTFEGVDGLVQVAIPAPHHY